jgi:hypothetical protein
MPAPQKSRASFPASSGPTLRASARCTEIGHLVDATGLHIATSGDRCALHCYSSEGTTVVRMSLALFVEHARADRDGNGRPFPAPKRRGEQNAGGEGQSAPTLGSSPSDAPQPARRKWGTARETYELAWRRWSADPEQPLRVIADELELKIGAMRTTFVRTHGEEYLRLIRARRGSASCIRIADTAP